MCVHGQISLQFWRQGITSTVHPANICTRIFMFQVRQEKALKVELPVLPSEEKMQMSRVHWPQN